MLFEYTDTHRVVYSMENGDYFTMEGHIFQVIDKGRPNHHCILYNLTRGKLYREPAYVIGQVLKLVKD